MSVAKRAIVSTLWTSCASYVAMAVGFIFGIFRDRILQPYDSGIYAFGMAMVDILFILSAVSFNISIIQADERKEDIYSTAFLMTVGLSVIMILCSVGLGYFLYERGTTAIKVEAFLVLSIFSVLNLYSMLFTSYLEKQLEYKRIARINLLAVLSFPITSLILVIHGWGAWGMVLGQVSSFVVSFIGMALISKFPFGFKFNFRTAKWFLSMGWKLIFSRGMEVVFVQYGTFITENLLGTAQQGSYNRVLKYWQMAPQTVAPAVVTVALPTYSKLQDDHEKLLQAFSMVIFFLVRTLMPFVLIFSFIPDSFIQIIGKQWLDGVSVLRILAIGALLSPLFENMKQLIYSQGQPEKIIRTRVVQLFVFIPAMYFLVQLYGISGAAIAMSLNYFIGVIGAAILLRNILTMNWFLQFFIPFIAAGVAGTITHFLPLPHISGRVVIQFFGEAFYLVGIFILFEVSIEWSQIKKYSVFIFRTMRSTSPPQ